MQLLNWCQTGAQHAPSSKQAEGDATMLQTAPMAGKALVNTAHYENYSRPECHEISRLPAKARGTKVSNIAR
jgi:hypothetical protein